ncbi:MAG: hypothetical protein V1649_01340 [Patescibacteria group bacterium]
MFQKFFYFIKYNNATVIILAIILMLGASVFAASPETIGQKQTQIIGIDNALLIQSDLDNFNMDFKIQNIEQDDQYYYVSYTYLDLIVIKQAWQYQLSEKTVKISKKIRQDIGIYMAKNLSKHHEARIRELKQEQILALANGEQNRIEETEYTGLIGKTLDLATAVFPNYEPVKKVELPSPTNFGLPNINSSAPASSGTDDLTKIYNDYIANNPNTTNNPNITNENPNITNENPYATNENEKNVKVVELLIVQESASETMTTESTTEPASDATTTNATSAKYNPNTTNENPDGTNENEKNVKNVKVVELPVVQESASETMTTESTAEPASDATTTKQ